MSSPARHFHNFVIEAPYGMRCHGCGFAIQAGGASYIPAEETLARRAARWDGRKSIAEWQKEIHEWARGKGFYDGDERRPAEFLMLMVSELGEALETLRNGHDPAEVWDLPVPSRKPEGFGIELADCIIRILDTCQFYGIDLEAMMRLKMAYNTTRPYRHGGKKL